MMAGKDIESLRYTKLSFPAEAGLDGAPCIAVGCWRVNELDLLPHSLYFYVFKVSIPYHAAV